MSIKTHEQTAYSYLMSGKEEPSERDDAQSAGRLLREKLRSWHPDSMFETLQPDEDRVLERYLDDALS